ncbi:ribonuclease H-like domain-containing protein [Tanacetum coccineum]
MEGAWPIGQGTDTAYLLLYVDDIVLTASFETLLQQIISSLHQKFSMTDLGSLNYFLGISVTRDSSKMFLSKRKYATEILERAAMSLAGYLQYLTFTRLDISYAVQQVCLYMHDPREPYFLTLKRVLRYVHGTLDYGLQLFSSSTTDLVAYSDADWAGCPTTQRSTSGYCVFLETTYSFGPLSVNRRCLILVQRQSIMVLPMLLLKHVDLVAAGQVRVLHVPSRHQYANIFTKGLPSALFEEFHTRSGYQQKDRKPSQNDKTEHGMEKTVQNQGQSPKMPKSESILKNTVGCNLNPSDGPGKPNSIIMKTVKTKWALNQLQQPICVQLTKTVKTLKAQS